MISEKILFGLDEVDLNPFKKEFELFSRIPTIYQAINESGLKIIDLWIASSTLKKLKKTLKKYRAE
jgi:hypothetical protein